MIAESAGIPVIPTAHVPSISACPWQWTHFLQPAYSASVVLLHRAEPVAYRDNSLDLNHKRSPAL